MMTHSWNKLLKLATLIIYSVGSVGNLQATTKCTSPYNFNNLDFKNTGEVEFNRTVYAAPDRSPIPLSLPATWHSHFVIDSANIQVKEMAKYSMEQQVSGRILINLNEEKEAVLGTWSLGPQYLSTGPTESHSWTRLLKFQLDHRFTLIDSYSCIKKNGGATVYRETRDSELTLLDNVTGKKHVIGEVSIYKVKDDISMDVYESKLIERENTYKEIE